jgi:hypothetical protein
VQALWRLARSGSAAPDALVIAQLQTRGAALGVALALLLVSGQPGPFAWCSSALCPVLAAMPHHSILFSMNAQPTPPSWFVMQ